MNERPRGKTNTRTRQRESTPEVTPDHTVAKAALMDFRHTDAWPHVRAYLLSLYPELPSYTQSQESVDAWIRVSNQREGFDKIFQLLGVVKDEHT